jgi:D-lactate dehydrogenase (cytochrome)
LKFGHLENLNVAAKALLHNFTNKRLGEKLQEFQKRIAADGRNEKPKGNFHVILPYDPEKKETYKKIREFSDLLIKKTLELDGTITGEHGVGLHKKDYLIKEHGDNIPLMKSIKRTIDPNNIMNPGKIFDLN